MTKRPTPQLFRVDIAPDAQREFHLLPPRVAQAVHRLLRTTMREDPENQGVRIRGQIKGYFLAWRSDFQIVYTVDHVGYTVSILRVEAR